MENNEKVMECKAPSLEGTSLENRKLIKECLEVSNFIVVQIASDNCLKETEPQISCLMSDLMSQNQDLTNLLDILLKIKGHITGN